jgi:hypothetical protein
MHILSLNAYPPPRADTFPSPGLATDFVSQGKKKTLKAREGQYKEERVYDLLVREEDT